MIVRSRYTASVSLLLLLLGVGFGQAWATPVTFSTSLISGNVPLESNGTTSSSVDDGLNSASSFLIVPTSTMGASVASDGSVFSVSTSTQHTDDWSCLVGCGAGLVGLSAVFDFDAVISAATPHEFSLTAQYNVLSVLFRVSVAADGVGGVTADASYGLNPVSVGVTTDSSGNTLVSTHFVGGMSLASCSTALGPCGLFSDTQGISLEMEGAGFVDASHTFSVNLTPTDPNVFLISADGRTAGALISTVPEPGTLFLLAAGLVPATLRFRRRR